VDGWHAHASTWACWHHCIDPPQTAKIDDIIVNVDDILETDRLFGEKWGAKVKLMTPSNLPRGGEINVGWIRLPPGRSIFPRHYHQREDGIFFMLSGTLTFIYGDEKKTVRAGDCISCPPATRIAHQIINESEEDATYLVIIPPDPDEVVVMPDRGKIMVRSLNYIGPIDTEDIEVEGLSLEEMFKLVTSGT
jgi:uncharacterized cupin superfamily protein